MDTRDFVASWGAVTGSLALFWNVYTWVRARPRLKITVQKGTTDYGIGLNPSTPTLDLEIINRGQETELLEIVGYSRQPKGRFQRKPLIDWAASVRPTFASLPHRIQTHGRWKAQIQWNDVLRDAEKQGNLFLGVRHSASDQPSLARVKLAE